MNQTLKTRPPPLPAVAFTYHQMRKILCPVLGFVDIIGQMPEPDDHQLLAEFARDQSEDAFAALVARYINLVYSTAFRCTGNPHHAEEISQAVFVILARKAGTISPRVVLSGWLYQATRLTAANFIKGEIRRQRREQEVYMQSTLNESNDSAWDEMAPLLDEAMGKLGQTDRDAVVLRFFQNKSSAEIGAALRMNEETARRRVNRALGKLHRYFSRRGVHSTTDVIANSISAHSIHAAPLGLAGTVSTVAIAKGVLASASTLTLIKGGLKIMAWTKAKTAIAVGVVAVIVGAGAFVICHRAIAHAASINQAFADSVPVRIDNDTFKPDGNRDGTFVVEVDHGTRRTTNSPPAIHIGGPLAPDGSNISPMPMAATGTYKKTDNSSSTTYQVDDGSALYGKRISVTGWIKTKDVQGWVGAFVIIVGKDGRHFQYDDMSDRPIRGTKDWQQVEIVTDLPDEPCMVYFGPDLYGPGELWGDDFQISLAPDEPITDDRNWRIASEADPAVYSETTDSAVTHDGHAAVCLAYTPDDPAPRGTNIRWSHDYYGSDSDKYRGHTVRMTGWLKTENVSGRFEPIILPFAGWNKLLAHYNNDGIHKGTQDWTQFSVTCHVPNGTEYVRTGFNFYGSGKAWIDEDSVKLEIVK